MDPDPPKEHGSDHILICITALKRPSQEIFGLCFFLRQSPWIHELFTSLIFSQLLRNFQIFDRKFQNMRVASFSKLKIKTIWKNIFMGFPKEGPQNGYILCTLYVHSFSIIANRIYWLKNYRTVLLLAADPRLFHSEPDPTFRFDSDPY